jgi:hypothetical protein
MAWEDRTPAEKRHALRQAAEYRRTDDDHIYVVITAKGTRLTVTGINSAKAVAGRDGTYQRRTSPDEPRTNETDEESR